MREDGWVANSELAFIKYLLCAWYSFKWIYWIFWPEFFKVSVTIITSYCTGENRDGRLSNFTRIKQLMSTRTKGLGPVRSNLGRWLRTWTLAPACWGVSPGYVINKLCDFEQITESLWALVSWHERWMMMSGSHLVGCLWDINELIFERHLEQCLACSEYYIYLSVC